MMENALSVNITRQGGYPYQSAATGEINYNDTCFYRRTGVTDGLTLRWVTDRFVLSGISSVQYIDDNMTLDQDFTPLDYFTLSQRRKEWAVTQDVVAKSVGDGSYRWLAGVFGFYKHTDMEAPVLFKEYGIKTLIEDKRNDANPYYPIKWDEDRFLLGSRFVMPVWGVARIIRAISSLAVVVVGRNARRLRAGYARLPQRVRYVVHDVERHRR